MTATLEIDLEQKRLAQRTQVRQRLAEIALIRRSIEELDVRIRGVDSRIETHVAKHQATTAPLQRELTDVEERMKAALSDRQEIATKDDAKHKELLRKIAEANSDLELAIAHEKKELSKLQRERQSLESQTTDEQMLQNKLAQEQLGNPDLLDAHHVARHTCNWANARCDSVKKELRKFEELLERDRKDWQRVNDSRSGWNKLTSGNGEPFESEYEKIVRRLRLELQVANEAAAAAQAEADAIYQKMLNE